MSVKKVYIAVEPKNERRIRKMKEFFKGVVAVFKILWKFIALGAMVFGIVGTCIDLKNGEL